MDYINIIIQAVIQGLTEFLPISSSGHLSVVQHFMNIREESLILMVVLHMGTLAAVFIAFWKDIWGVIKEFFFSIRDICTGRFSWKEMNDSRRMLFMIILSTFVLVPFYFFKDFFTSMEGDGDIIFEGAAFLFTALVLFLSDRCTKGEKTGKDITVKDSLVIGLFQCIALFPGVSRSGSTISGGLFSGLTRSTAVTYAFILGIPAILGGGVLELREAIQTEMALDWVALGIGFLISTVVGLLSIQLVKLLIKRNSFKIFGIIHL